MLIDTHILVWVVQGTAGNMGIKTLKLVQGSLDGYTVSAASLMEIRLKQRRGGLEDLTIGRLMGGLKLSGVNMLDILPSHIIHIPDSDVIEHADPFDLTLMAQAIAEGLPLLTCDEKILDANIPGLRLVDGRK